LGIHSTVGRGGEARAAQEVLTMARMNGVEPGEAGWFTRLVYWLVKREVSKLTGQPRLLEPIKITAHHPRLLKALGQMEGGQAAAKSVPASLKFLASIKAAALVGCPLAGRA
jgi:4-carboxymuconolactone decarboxylase